MDISVAAGAWCQLRRSCAHAMNRGCCNRTVALVAQRVDIRHIQEPCVLRSVRSVTSEAAFSFHRGVLIDKWSARFCVAFCADRILIGGGLQVVVPECTVRVVTVAAFDQLFIHLVVKRHVELRLYVRVALEAELRLRRLQQVGLGVARVYAMATGAAYAGLGMRRTQKVRMRARMAAQAGRIDVLFRHLAQLLDLGYVAAAFHVGLACPVAALARRTLTAMQQGQL